MVEPLKEFYPSIKTGLLGFKRSLNAANSTVNTICYLNNLPLDLSGSIVLLLDPMLATGNTAIEALKILESKNPHSLLFISLIAAPEGVAAVSQAYPSLPIFTASLDRGLDRNFFIRPGLGDFGDRYFGQ